MKAITILCVPMILMAEICLAQAPVGTIAGVVRDPSAAVILHAQVQAVSRATGLARTTVTAEQGDYSFPALLPGDYEVSAEAPGSPRIIRTATVEAGSTTTANFDLLVGEVTESVTVDDAIPQMHYVSHTVGGVVTQGQIEGLPLNGRSFLELAKLEPGVQPPTRSNANRTLVPVLGSPGVNVGGTRFTVDGGSVTSVGVGGSEMGHLTGPQAACFPGRRFWQSGPMMWWLTHELVSRSTT